MKKICTILSATVLCLSGCTPTVATHGNIIQDYQVTGIQSGRHTREDVRRLLGSPTVTSSFSDKIWYYVGKKTAKRGILDPKVTQERIVEIVFSDAGLVESVREIDAEDRDVPISDRETPTSGNDTTLIQQFLGNIGRFAPPGGQNE